MRANQRFAISIGQRPTPRVVDGLVRVDSRRGGPFLAQENPAGDTKASARALTFESKPVIIEAVETPRVQTYPDARVWKPQVQGRLKFARKRAS